MKKRSILKKIVALLLSLIFLFNYVVVFALYDDNAGTNSGNYGDGYEIGSGGDWTVTGNCTGTIYTIYYEGQYYTYELAAGDQIEGTEIKGYNSAANAGGITDPEFQLEAAGNITITPEDFAALARANGDYELAEVIENGGSFVASSEQYIDMKNPATGEVERVPATVAMKMLQEHYANGGDDYEGIAFLQNVIEESYGSFFEEENPYLYELFGGYLEEGIGKGIFAFEDLLNAILGFLSGKGPDPDPDPEPKEHPILSVSIGYANDSEVGYAKGNVDNSEFKVANGQNAGEPIPTSENLTGSACTNIIGKVENLRRIYNEL